MSTSGHHKRHRQDIDAPLGRDKLVEYLKPFHSLPVIRDHIDETLLNTICLEILNHLLSEARDLVMNSDSQHIAT